MIDEHDEEEPDADLQEHEFLLRVRCHSEQPEAFVAAAAASGAATMLDGWTVHPSVTIEHLKEVSEN